MFDFIAFDAVVCVIDKCRSYLCYMSGKVDARQLNTKNVVSYFVQSHSHCLAAL